MSAKKITKIVDKNSSRKEVEQKESIQQPKGDFRVPDTDKVKAKKFRFIAVGLWIVALGLEIGAIMLLRQVPVSMFWLITLIVLDLIFAVAGAYFWKQSNKLDPASEKEKVRFMIQNQLGVIIAIIVFLPLVILIFTNKNLSSKQKGIAGTVGVVALLVAGFFGIDFDPTSLEQLEEENRIEQTEEGNQASEDDSNSTYDESVVYWTKSGKSYHLYSDCSYINTYKTDEIFQGNKTQAKDLKNITDICDRCERQLQRSLSEE